MFNRIDQKKSFHETGHELLIRSDDISRMLQNTYLHDLKSHFIVTKDGSYEDKKPFIFGIAPDRIKLLEEAYQKGLTILIKDLENWNENIQAKCRSLGSSTNTHLYLTPENGSSFDWHTDDRDVYVYLQKGEKKFQVEESDGYVSTYVLRPGSLLFIPYGAKHRAEVSGPSVHLSFGVWPEGKTIRELYESFNLPLTL